MLNIFKSPNKITQHNVIKSNNEINLEDPLVKKIREKLDIQDQEIFIQSFYAYMNYHPTNNFPINLEHVFKMIGFVKKANAMKTIKSNFVLNEDYKIIIFRTEKNKSIQETRGRKEETIMLNVDTFKNLCMIAKTEKGKEIRKYYIKMEEIIIEYTKEQLQTQSERLQMQLKAKEQQSEQLQTQLQMQLKAKELQLEEKEQELVRYKEKTYEEIQKTGHIYVIKTDGGYKVGKTKDVNSRIKGLQTGNVNNIEVILDFKTSNSDLLERIVHYLLDRYRCNSNREFFDCDVEYIKLIIKIVGDTMDTLKSTYQHISKEELINKLNYIKEIPGPLPEYETINKKKENVFYNWLEENIKYKENEVLQLKEVCQIYLGKNKVHSSFSSIYKKEIEKYIKEKYKNVK
jgi:phage anti-repressor protein